MIIKQEQEQNILLSGKASTVGLEVLLAIY